MGNSIVKVNVNNLFKGYGCIKSKYKVNIYRKNKSQTKKIRSLELKIKKILL